MEPELSAVIIAVPEAEALVGRLRAELDPHSAWGVPAHVTVLVPFVAPALIDDDVLSALAAAVATVPAFSATFREVGWFGEDVLYLAPEPAVEFVALTRAVEERFGLRAYDGRFGDDHVPHLTVSLGATPSRLRDAAVELAAGLPLCAEISRVRVIVGRPSISPWTTLTELPLG